MSLHAFLALPLLLAGPQDQDPITYQGRAFVFQADLPAARARGWIDADEDEGTVLEGIRTALEARLRGTGLFVEAEVLAEEGGRFAAVFVGDQSQAIEAMLTEGLASAGRLELRLRAEDADLARAGSTLAAERERLDAWLADHPEAGPALFNGVPAADGGPVPALRWVAGSEGPVALLRRPLGLVPRADMEVGLRMRQDDDGSYRLFFTLQERPAEELNRKLGPHQGRTLVVVLNDAAVEERPIEGAVQFPLGAGAGYTIEQVRPLLLATGFALDAPLTYVERTTRELEHVKRRPTHGDKPFKGEDD